jgi:hypothetical protein
MLSIILFCSIALYNYIGKYIFFIPTTLLYLNYFKVNRLDNYNNINNKINIISNNNYIKKNINIIKNFNYKNFILNNSNNKVLYIFIKFDNIILIITNEFLSFILYYLKKCIKYIISNQFSYSTINIQNQSNINERKKKLVNLISKTN